jgi:hypothetical protein
MKPTSGQARFPYSTTHVAIPQHFPYTSVIPTNVQTVHCQKLGAPGKVLKEKTYVTYPIDAESHCGLAG